MCLSVYCRLECIVCIRGLVNEQLTLRASPRARGGLLHWLQLSHAEIKWTRCYVGAKGCGVCMECVLLPSVCYYLFCTLLFLSSFNVRLLLSPAHAFSHLHNSFPSVYSLIPPSICLVYVGVVGWTCAKSHPLLVFVHSSFDNFMAFPDHHFPENYINVWTSTEMLSNDDVSFKQRATRGCYTSFMTFALCIHNNVRFFLILQNSFRISHFLISDTYAVFSKNLKALSFSSHGDINRWHHRVVRCELNWATLSGSPWVCQTDGGSNIMRPGKKLKILSRKFRFSRTRFHKI